MPRLLVIFAGVGSQPSPRLRRAGATGACGIRSFSSGAAVGTLAVIALGSGFKTLELAQGGSTVATMLGGRLVDPTTTDPDERKLRNVVEEMAIAAGVPVPQVYVLPEERGINAFAAGPLDQRRRGRRHGGRHEAAHARRAAGRHRPRVQPHPQRRHAAQPAPDGHHLRHPVPGRHWPGPALHPQPQQQGQEPAAAAGAGADRDRLGRRLLRPAHPGRRQPPARVPGRRLVGAVHAQPGGAGRRAEEDRRPELRLEARGGPRRRKPATCSSATAWASRSST